MTGAIPVPCQFFWGHTTPSGIGNVIRGNADTAGGYHCRKYEEDIQENVTQEEQRVKSLELIEWANDKE